MGLRSGYIAEILFDCSRRVYLHWMRATYAREFLDFVDAPWKDEGACSEVSDPDIFFPERGQGAKAAKAICNRCPVRAECLAYALATVAPADDFGVWGGTSPQERQRIRKARRRRRLAAYVQLVASQMRLVSVVPGQYRSRQV